MDKVNPDRVSGQLLVTVMDAAAILRVGRSTRLRHGWTWGPRPRSHCSREPGRPFATHSPLLNMTSRRGDDERPDTVANDRWR